MTAPFHIAKRCLSVPTVPGPLPALGITHFYTLARLVGLWQYLTVVSTQFPRWLMTWSLLPCAFRPAAPLRRSIYSDLLLILIGLFSYHQIVRVLDLAKENMQGPEQNHSVQEGRDINCHQCSLSPTSRAFCASSTPVLRLTGPFQCEERSRLSWP